MRRYSSGDWYALVTNDGVAMLPNNVTPELVESVWLALGDGGGLAAVLEGIVGGFGTSLSALPPFAVVSRATSGDEVRVAVRGPLEVRAAAVGGDVVVAGLGVTTWNERGVSGVESVMVGIPGVGSPRLPINDGVVLADQITFEFGERATPPASVEPAVALELPEPSPDEPRAEVARTEERRVEEPEPGPEVSEEPAPSGETTIAPLVGEPFEGGTADDEASATEDYDRLLFGDTTKRSVEGAAVRSSDEAFAEAPLTAPALISGLPQFASPPSSEGSALPELGDHDGETISTAKLRAMLAREGSVTGAAGSGGVAPDPKVPAVLVVSTGERVALDRGAVVGRRPQLVRVQGSNVPRLVTVPSPSQDISRSHVELRLVGQDLLAVDLNTTNGTRLLRPGFDPIRLQPAEPTILVSGDRLDLGDGVELGFEGLR